MPLPTDTGNSTTAVLLSEPTAGSTFSPASFNAGSRSELLLSRTLV
jgi:hypothetical protein